jgi:hypothetical protein
VQSWLVAFKLTGAKVKSKDKDSGKYPAVFKVFKSKVRKEV